MANVNIKFNGKEFLLSCDNGQEEHLEELSLHLNKKFEELKNNLGNIGENKLLLITSIKIMDEYFETKKKIDEQKKELKDLSNKFRELKSLVYEYKEEKEKEIEQLVQEQNSFKKEIEKSKEDYEKIIDNAADQIEGLLTDERIRLSRIMNNVEEITLNLRKSNDTVKAIIGNVKQITDDLVTADFKETIAQATQTIKHVNKILDEAASGNGTLGKLLTDDKLYFDIIESNKALQDLVNDLKAHPERYIHFSVFGAKTKGVPLTVDQEDKLMKILE